MKLPIYRCLKPFYFFKKDATVVELKSRVAESAAEVKRLRDENEDLKCKLDKEKGLNSMLQVFSKLIFSFSLIY